MKYSELIVDIIENSSYYRAITVLPNNSRVILSITYELLSDIIDSDKSVRTRLERLASAKAWFINELSKISESSIVSPITYLMYVNGKWEVMHDRTKNKQRECLCSDKDCAKCLSINCQGKDCLIHTREEKVAWRKRWEQANKKQFPHAENY